MEGCNVARYFGIEKCIPRKTFGNRHSSCQPQYLYSMKTNKKQIIMKKFILSAALMVIGFASANAQSWISTTNRTNRSSYSQSSNINSSSRYQQGYTRSNGTYVIGHMKTNSNETNHDNYSTRGNSNPFTGSNGTVARDYSSQSYNYGSGQTIHTGSRGGQYYINSNGNKTYVPKRNSFGY